MGSSKKSKGKQRGGAAAGVGRSGSGGGGRIKHNIARKKHTWRSVRVKKSKGGDASSPPEPIFVKKRSKTKASSGVSSLKPGNEEELSGSLRARMMQRLNVAKFRQVNEALDGGAKTNPLDDEKTFAAYHEGFESAQKSWTVHPLDRIVNLIMENVPTNHVVADFGCGSARLATSIPNTTHSFDLHAANELVTKCDVRKTPLEDKSVHVVVFCLSLMGRDVGRFFLEANRVLKMGGIVFVAEVLGRIPELGKFVKDVARAGFKRIDTEQLGGDDVFVLARFRKVKDELRLNKIRLEACKYKNR